MGLLPAVVVQVIRGQVWGDVVVVAEPTLICRTSKNGVCSFAALCEDTEVAELV